MWFGNLCHAASIVTTFHTAVTCELHNHFYGCIWASKLHMILKLFSDWLSTMARESNLPCYLTLSWGREYAYSYLSQGYLCKSKCDKFKLRFKHGSPICSIKLLLSYWSSSSIVILAKNNSSIISGRRGGALLFTGETVGHL